VVTVVVAVVVVSTAEAGAAAVASMAAKVVAILTEAAKDRGKAALTVADDPMAEEATPALVDRKLAAA
jgi:hypothetical protein